MIMKPYQDIIPDTADPVVAMQLDRKSGKIPKGTYGFLEYYCTDKGCDCRRVTLQVVSRSQQKQLAVISMGFDPDDPFCGPYLDDLSPQAACAEQLLELFVDALNHNPEVLESFYRHYREVRTKVDGRKYRGKPFPKPDKTIIKVCPSPTIDDVLERHLTTSPATVRSEKTTVSRDTASQLRQVAARYCSGNSTAGKESRDRLQRELRDCLYAQTNFAGQLCDLLIEAALDVSGQDERVDDLLLLFLDTLEILRVEIERKRPRSTEVNRHLQETLAQRIFLENADPNLQLALAHLLLESRLELLPVLSEAYTQRMMLDSPALSQQHSSEDIIENLYKGIEGLHGSCPFETMEQLLTMIALQPTESQIGMIEQMLAGPTPLIRDTAALMIMHPDAVVRQAVATLLPEYAADITPEALRRLIISRNWFPEEIRSCVDQAISAARKARVVCAPLTRPEKTTVYISVVDGAFAQSLQVLLPEAKGFVSCSMLLKRGRGVADAFIIPLPTKRERDHFLKVLTDQTGAAECDMAHLDQRVCHTLAEGAALGKPPYYRLLQIAERLGKDNWKAIPFDAVQEFEALRAELAQTSPELLAAVARKRSLDQSEHWPFDYAFASSWFEDDNDVDTVVHTIMQQRRKTGSFESQAAKALLKLLEQRRETWLDRLVLTTLWLRSCRKAAVPWQQMFHVAGAVADTATPLSAIPLMETIAYHSLGACLARQGKQS